MFAKKGKIIAIACVIGCICSCLFFTACKFGKKPSSEQHVHAFEENALNEYLISQATCIQRAFYYKSCECGEVSDQTFEFGEFAPHDFCENVDDNYLKHEATCTQKAVYYKSCYICGERSDDVFEYGYLNEHSYGEWIEEVPATCQTNGIKGHYTCLECKNTFNEYGESMDDLTIPADHTYSDKWSFNDTHHWNAALCGCNVKQNYSRHALGDDGCCAVCGRPVADENGVIYAISENGEYAEVTGYNGNAEKVKIASAYSGLPVKVIRENAFKNSNITFIVIPNGVTEICDYAFDGCVNLANVVLPESLEKIGNAFPDLRDWGYLYYEGTLEQWVQIQFSAKSNVFNNVYTFYADDQPVTDAKITQTIEISDYAFLNYKGLNSVYIGGNVKKIGYQSFFDCSYLKDVFIDEGVTEICDYAFDDCGWIENISLPSTLTSFGDDVFDLNWDVDYTEYEGCYYVGNAKNPYLCLIMGKKEIEFLTINKNTKFIYSSALRISSGLNEIVIPDGVLSIGKEAFYACGNVTKAVIPDSVVRIGDFAFDYCTAITDLSIGKGVKTIGKQAFEHSNVQKLKTPVEAINHLYDKYYLKQVEIVGGGTIPVHAFVNCENLTKVTMTDEITGIGVWAFYGCSSLTDINISKNIVKIDDGAFMGCSKLTNVILGENIMSIGQQAFAECTNLVFNEHDKANYLGTESNPYLYLIEAKTKNIGHVNKPDCEIHPYTRVIAEFAFDRCDFKEIVISGNVAVIGEYAFADMSDLKTVRYRGTASEWNAISKSKNSFTGSSATQVQCTDQTVDL